VKKFIACALALFSSLSFGTTLNPITLLNPAGSTAGQAIISTGPSGAPVWGAVPLTGITGTLAITNGGTGATSASAARTNLGLGTAATQNTGTSGATVPLLNGANTWASAQTFSVRPTFNGATPWDSGNLASPAATTGNLSQFAATTSAQLAGVLSDETGSGSAVFGTSPTISTPTINGITNGSSAAAGVVGELKTNTGSGVSMTSGAAITCTSVALTAGKWLVWANVSYTAAGSTTVSFLSSSISQANNTGGPTSATQTINASFVTGGGQTLAATPTLLNLSSSGTAYAVGLAFFGVSTMTCGGAISALRIL
jgi:hypothetical protein